MIKYKIKKVQKKIEKAYICDICKLEYPISDIGEIQEFIHIKRSCGYNSIFSDLSEYSLDICQHCVAKIFGKEFIMEKLRRY